MEEDNEYDPDWWKEDRDASLERKQAEATRASGVSLGDTFLIVTEGTVTEPVYFELLLEFMELSQVSVVVIPGRHSDPRHVISTGYDVAKKQLRKAAKKQLSVSEPERFDHVWAVIDTDVATRNKIWNDVIQLAKSKKVNLAQSTPCFEYWILLHLSECTTRGDLVNGDAAKHVVKQIIGGEYSTNEETTRKVFEGTVKLWEKAADCASRVRKHHANAGTALPASPSTDVDLLVRSLRDSVQKCNRT